MACCGGPRRISSPEDPIVLGDPVGAPIRARVTVSMDGLTSGDPGWFDGTDLAVYLDRRLLVALD